MKNLMRISNLPNMHRIHYQYYVCRDTGKIFVEAKFGEYLEVKPVIGGFGGTAYRLFLQDFIETKLVFLEEVLDAIDLYDKFVKDGFMRLNSILKFITVHPMYYYHPTTGNVYKLDFKKLELEALPESDCGDYPILNKRKSKYELYSSKKH